MEREPRLVFWIADRAGPYRPLSFRENEGDRKPASLHDMMLKAGFKAGDRILMTLAPKEVNDADNG